MDIKEQIKNALKGDLDSFNQIVLEYQNLVYNQAYRITILNAFKFLKNL